MTYVLAYDIGTTGVKTCLFGIGERITLLSSAQEGYKLYLLPGGGAEQEPDAWWGAMCRTTRALFTKTDVAPQAVAGLSFCSQTQGLVLVDRAGKPVRRAMSYMDQRAGAELKKGLAHGPQVWKYKWVQAHEPENFLRADKWLDVKDYLLLRCTGRAVMTEDSAYAALLYDTRKGAWSGELCRIFGVDMAHLPPIIQASSQVGGLTGQAAAELGLTPGTPVFGGGGDASLIGVGAGATAVGSTHIYCGTSGWVSTVTDRQRVDVSAMIAAIVGAQRGRYNYFAEMETAGKCLEWVKDHLALDEIGVYLEKKDITGGQEAVYASLYDYLTETVEQVPPGAGGVLFTPWLHGNRCPFEDPAAAGMFFNIRLDTGKTELIRAVLEGVCYHLRWMLECQARKLPVSDPVRFVGGGALSPVTAQILADVTGRAVQVTASPQNAGSVGAAAVAGVGLGIVRDLDAAAGLIPVERTHTPRPANRAAYDQNYQVFQKLYPSNRALFRALNGG